MAARARVELDGYRQLRSTLRKAGVDANELRRPNLEAAKIVAAAASATTPRRAGRLADSVRAGATQRAGIVRAGRRLVPYAGPIHWGWPARGITAQPWLSTAATATEDQWLTVFHHHIDQLIDSVKGL